MKCNTLYQTAWAYTCIQFNKIFSQFIKIILRFILLCTKYLLKCDIIRQFDNENHKDLNPSVVTIMLPICTRIVLQISTYPQALSVGCLLISKVALSIEWRPILLPLGEYRQIGGSSWCIWCYLRFLCKQYFVTSTTRRCLPYQEQEVFSTEDKTQDCFRELNPPCIISCVQFM